MLLKVYNVHVLIINVIWFKIIPVKYLCGSFLIPSPTNGVLTACRIPTQKYLRYLVVGGMPAFLTRTQRYQCVVQVSPTTAING